MICPKCKVLVDEQVTKCLNCGADLTPQVEHSGPAIEEIYTPQPTPQPQPTYQTVQQSINTYQPAPVKEKIKPWLVALCVQIPLLGLIMWAVKSDDKELAEGYGKPALWSFIFTTAISVVLTIFYFIFFIVLMATA